MEDTQQSKLPPLKLSKLKHSKSSQIRKGKKQTKRSRSKNLFLHIMTQTSNRRYCLIRKFGMGKSSLSTIRFKTQDGRGSMSKESQSRTNFSTVKSVFGRCKVQETKVLRQNDIGKSK
jgi:hypothetical protein